MQLELFTNTEAFIERKSNGRSLQWEIILVLIVGALGGAGMGYLGREFLNTTAAGGLTFQVIGFVVRPILGAVVVWFGVSVWAHLAARYYNGRGPISRLLKLSAWGLVPLGIGNLLRSLGIVLGTSTATITSETVAFQPVVDSVLSSIPVIVGTLLLLLTVVWSSYYLAIAVRHTKDIDRTAAQRIVAVPMAILALVVLRDLLQSLGAI